MSAVRRLAAIAIVLSVSAALPAGADETKGKEVVSTPVVTTPPASDTAQAPAASQATSSPITITHDGKTVKCREQGPQAFLVRGNWFPKTNDAEKVKAGRKLLDDAIKYRTEQYGYFEGFGSSKWNAHPPKHYAKNTTFMGMSMTVNEKIIPALACVEAALKANGADAQYKPKSSSGIRFKNTYRGVEISNHIYGIAVDIEPDRNSCCGCVAPWNENPVCKQKKTVWERMAMPKTWVDTFEKYGFYWLGHDTLQDTMHFEFLGEPDKILETP